MGWCTRSETKVPEPCLASTRPSAASVSNALRKVTRDTPRISHICRSEGSASPAFQRPLRMASVRRLASCR